MLELNIVYSMKESKGQTNVFVSFLFFFCNNNTCTSLKYIILKNFMANNINIKFTEDLFILNVQSIFVTDDILKLILLFLWEHKTWYFMWIVCLIFSEK